MVVSISYSEVEQYIAHHFQREITFKLEDSSQLNIATPLKVLGFTKYISINIGVVKIENAKIFLTYSGKLGIDLLVTQTIAFFRRLLPEKANFIRTDTGNVIELNLQEIDELQSVFEKMDLQSITFEENSFHIEADLKS